MKASKPVRVLAWTAFALTALAVLAATHLYFEGRPRHGRPQYVAMGSSFAAGPAISERADDSPWFCARSRDNYAHQLARLRGLALVDRSCGGATTRDILEGGLALQPAQIEAVTAETELVTLTIGGNDIDFIGDMMAMGCAGGMPWTVRIIGGCRIRSIEKVERELPQVEVRLVRIIGEVRRRAPKAKVVLVTYPAILPEQGSCERLGLSPEQAAQMRGVAEQLAQVTAAVADGAMLLDAVRLTRGHDVCAQEPWINGMRPAGGLLGAPLHPNLAGMTAIAQGLNGLLGEALRVQAAYSPAPGSSS